MTGVVAAVVAGRGFGFIQADEGGRDFFFHYTGLERPLTFDTLVGGERVVFETETGDRGPRAVNVRRA